MTKTEFVRQLAKKAGTTIIEADKFLEAFQETLLETVRDGGEELVLKGFGKFKPKKQETTERLNALTGKNCTVRGYKSLAFSASYSAKKYED